MFNIYNDFSLIKSIPTVGTKQQLLFFGEEMNIHFTLHTQIYQAPARIHNTFNLRESAKPTIVYKISIVC